MPENNCEANALMDVADNLFQAARDEYRFYALDIKNRQTKIQNIYFWIASVMFTVYGTVFYGMFTGTGYIHLQLVQIEPVVIPKLLVCASFALCIWVIITGVSAMRGRNEARDILGGYSAYSTLESYINTPNLEPIDAMRDLLKICQDNTLSLREEPARIGAHLRRTSAALVAAMICGILAFLF